MQDKAFTNGNQLIAWSVLPIQLIAWSVPPIHETIQP
jgi:hypothetical protein